MSQAPTSSEGPLAAFRAQIREGTLHSDPAQRLAVEKLQSLHHALADDRPATGIAGRLGG